MTANKQSIWPDILRKPFIRFGTANTNRDGSGTLATLYTAPATTPSVRVSRVDFKAEGTTTAGILRLFLDRSGTFLFISEVLVTAITPSGTVASWESSFIPSNVDGFIMQPGDILKCSTHNGEFFYARAELGEF